MASTDPRTLAAAFIAHAHSTAFDSVLADPPPHSARRPVGNGMPIENPSGTSTYMLLTTGPLGGETYAASSASQCEFVMLTGGCAQKNGREYPSCTVCPPNHASVKPMLMQLAPPSRQGVRPHAVRRERRVLGGLRVVAGEGRIREVRLRRRLVE